MYSPIKRDPLTLFNLKREKEAFEAEIRNFKTDNILAFCNRYIWLIFILLIHYIINIYHIINTFIALYVYFNLTMDEALMMKKGLIEHPHQSRDQWMDHSIVLQVHL